MPDPIAVPGRDGNVRCAQAHGIRIGGRPFFHVCHFLLLGLAASQRHQRFRMFYKNFTRVNI